MTAGHLSFVSSLAYLAAYFGARTFAILVEEDEPFKFYKLLEPGAMTLYGGLLAGGVVLFALGPRGSTAKKQLLDSLALATCLGVSIGRIGCFLNGDDYGILYLGHGFWSFLTVSFPNHNHPQPRIAVQLLESFFAFLIFLTFNSIRKRNFKILPGVIGCWTIIAYSIFRLMIEFLRDDPRGYFLGTRFSPGQGLSLIFLCFAVYTLIRLHPAERIHQL